MTSLTLLQKEGEKSELEISPEIYSIKTLSSPQLFSHTLELRLGFCIFTVSQIKNTIYAYTPI